MACVLTKKPHKLLTISVKPANGINDYEVIRWCEDCGAVVIDIDTDGITYPGDVMSMMFPKISKEHKNA